MSVDIYLAARRGLVEYRKVFLSSVDDVEAAGYHYQWSKELLNGDGHIAIEGFRESGKTSLILRAFPLYALTFPDDAWKYIVIIKSNMQQARKVLRGVVDEYLHNPLLNGRMRKVIKNTADIFEVELDSGVVTIEVYGKGASIRGLNNKDVRPTILILDDPQDSADMNSETVPENDWEWFLGDVMFLGHTARVFLIGNNLGERCIVERVAANAKVLGFKFKRIPCANDDLTVSAWPEKYSIDDIKKERDNYETVGELDVWLREKMCVAVNDQTRIFKEEYFAYYTPSLADMICDRGMVYAALDPASSKERTACFRAISVVSVMPDGHIYVLEMPYGRWDANELMDKIFEMVRKWGFKDFGIEKGQLQQFMEPILYSEMTRRNIRFNIVPLEHGKIGSKLQRIKMLQPRFRCRSIWFPDYSYWLNELKAELSGVTNTEIKSLMIDLVDCLAMVCLQMVDVPLSSDARVDRMKKNLQLEAVR
jgi:predicted phage terminase large subunit-like protein